jgi:hypothetical protein
MPAPASYARRQFPGAASDTTIVTGINGAVTACTLTTTTGWPTGAFTGGILIELYDTTTGVTLEKVWGTDLTGATLTIVRAADGTSATSHSAGTGIRAIAGAIDADEANRAVNETIGQLSAAGQVLVADGAASAVALQTKDSGKILQGNGTTLTSVAVSGDATIAVGGAVTIANDAITAAKIAANAVGSSEIAADAVGSSEIAASAVGNAELGADAVDGTKIADDAIDSEHYVDGSIDTAHIANLQVTAGKIANDTITATQIAANAIGTSELADNAVDSGAIAALAVLHTKVAAFPGCEVADSSDSIADSSPDSVLFGAGSEVFDTGGFYDNTGSNILTVPAGCGGVYIATAWCEWDSNATGIRIISLEKNGPAGAGSYFGRQQLSDVANARMGVSGMVVLAAADTVALTMFQNSGGTRTVDSHLSLMKLSGTP